MSCVDIKVSRRAVVLENSSAYALPTMALADAARMERDLTRSPWSNACMALALARAVSNSNCFLATVSLTLYLP